MQRPRGGATRLPFSLGKMRTALIADGQLGERASLSARPAPHTSRYWMESGELRWVVHHTTNTDDATTGEQLLSFGGYTVQRMDSSNR